MDWSQWATPQGITALVGAIGTVLTLVALIMSMTGHKETAQKVTDANTKLQSSQQQLQTAAEVIRGVVQGVEDAKSGLDSEDRKNLITAIEDAATKMGAQTALDPIVQAIQGGKADLPTILSTLKATLAGVQAPTKPPTA